MTQHWPTEEALTAGVKAAARAAWEQALDRLGANDVPEWDTLPPVRKFEIHDALAGQVYAALSAIPDPRWQAFVEGQLAGVNGENPYPAPSLDLL